MPKFELPTLPAPLGWYAINDPATGLRQRFFPIYGATGAPSPFITAIILDGTRMPSKYFADEFGHDGLHREIDRFDAGRYVCIAHRSGPTTPEREAEILEAMRRELTGVWYCVMFSGFDTPEVVAAKIQAGIDAMTMVVTAPERSLALQ